MNLELTKRLARRCTAVAAIAAAFTVLGCAETGDGDGNGNGGATTQPAEQTTSKVTEPTSPEASDAETPDLEASNLQASDDEATENASTESASTEDASSGTTTLVFNVRGMHCGGCASAVDATVSKLAGVESCAASFENSSAEVVVSDPEASAQIMEAIAKMGYEIEPADESGS